MNIRYSAIALAVLGFSASAQDSPKFKQLLAMDLGEMLKVEVATGTAKQLSEAPAVVSVITADDIKVTGARTLGEALERIPGLHVSASVNRVNSMFTIRGIQTDSTPQVLVLLDGVNISELTTWSTNFSFRYPTNFIERIEIIRGPGSAVYGADAFSGVINIITKSSSKNEGFEFGTNVGSFDYIESWLNGNFAFDELKVNLSITHEEQGNDNDRITPFGVMQRDRDMDNIHLNMEYGDFAMKNWYYRIHQKMGVGPGIFGNDVDRDIGEIWKTQVNWSGTITSEIDASANVSYVRSRYDALFQLFPPGEWLVGADGNVFQPPFIPVQFPDGIIGQPQGTTNKFNINAAAIYSGIEGHRLRLGLGIENSELTDVQELKNFGPGVLDEANIPNDFVSRTLVDVSGTPFIYTPDYDRDLKFISIQDEWKFAENWELTAGLRYDDYSDFGSTTNPRLALVWNSTETLTSKLLYGTAFRAPKVAELAFINNPSVLGNQNLDPEKIKTIELAFDYRPNNNFSGLLNIFTYKSEDLIQLDSDNIYQNIGEQDGQGVEIEANWQATEKLRLNANISWLDSDLPLIDQDKEQVPGFMGFLDVRYQIADEWLLTVQNYLINDRKRQAGDTRPEVDDYVKTDLTLLWQSEASWSFKLGVKNLFDDDIREPVPNSGLFGLNLGFPGDYPMESRSIFGSVKLEF